MNEVERREMLSKLIDALLPKPSDVVSSAKSVKPKRSYEYKDKAKAEQKREANKVALRLSRISTSLTSTAKYMEQDMPLLESQYQGLSADSKKKVDKYLASIQAKKSVLKEHFLKLAHVGGGVAATSDVVNNDGASLLGDNCLAAQEVEANTPNLDALDGGEPCTPSILPSAVAAKDLDLGGRESPAGSMEVDTPSQVQCQAPIQSELDSRDATRQTASYPYSTKSSVPDSAAANRRPVSPVHQRVEPPSRSSRTHSANPAPTKRKATFAASHDEQYYMVPAADAEEYPPSMDDTLDSQQPVEPRAQFRHRESFQRPGNFSGRLPQFDQQGRNTAPTGVSPLQSKSNVKDLLRRSMFPEHF